MQTPDYHKKIIDYYAATENSYRDAWDLDNSLAIHYDYWDEKVTSFPQSLLRMNEVMIEAAGIADGEAVLDAGCGIGGSALFIASVIGAKVTGITLSEKQVMQAVAIAGKKDVSGLVEFKAMNYAATSFPDASFDVVWGCESICYADDKELFIREAWRLLKPGGRLVVADGFVPELENNDHPVIRQMLDGWEVNYLETPERFQQFMQQAGFGNIRYRNISRYTAHSSRRLYRFYHLALLYQLWKRLSFSNPATPVQKRNILTCKYQYHGMKKGLWQYGLVSGCKPG